MKARSLFAAALALFLAAGPAAATDPLSVTGAWVREGPPGSPVLAAYMRIDNPGDVEQVITGAQSPQFQSVEIHRTEIQDGMARMVPQTRLAVPAGGSALLEPGGLHLMLIEARGALQRGEQVQIELQLQDGSRMRVEAEIRQGAAAEMDHSHHHHH